MNDSEKPKSSWRERRQSIKHKWLALFIFPEWFCERLSYILGRWAFLEILGHVGRLTILVAVVFYFAESGSRQKAKHYQAWQVINAAQGKTGSGGRMDALQDLHKDGISLTGVDISKAYLPELNLEKADLREANLAGAKLFQANLAEAILRYANLTEADLIGANLTGAKLFQANLTKAYLRYANLTEAILRYANLTEADLIRANLTGAKLFQANLTEADLSDANLTEADLFKAILVGTDLRGANLAGAKLSEANLTGAFLSDTNLTEANLRETNLNNIQDWLFIQSIELANIYDVYNPPDGFIEWATEHGAVSMRYDEWEKLLREKEQEKTKEK